jgi:diguanylate cyclase (GGDEF)-like protein
MVAILASYTALEMAGRVSANHGRVARTWLAGGSFAMGVGIWSMHFIGMLAFRLPVRMDYAVGGTLLSLMVAVASSAFALVVVCRQSLSWPRLSGSAVLMGSGICSMHYIGMAAMPMSPHPRYIPWLVATSLLIAVAASGVALWITFHLRRQSSRHGWLRVAAAVVMGLGIGGMHYTGMAAAQFPANSICAISHSGVTTGWLAFVTTGFAFCVLGFALIIAVFDSRLESRTAVLADSLAKANEDLRFLALHDILTQLPNRALLDDRLEQEIRHANRNNTSFSVLFADIDGFKQINDAHGHQVGDSLLVELARRIRTAVRAEDTVARFGGDEFVLAARTAEPVDAANLAEKIVFAIREPARIAEHEFRVSVSIGIVTYRKGIATKQDLLKHADAAMYHAKASGRDRYCFFDSSMDVEAHSNLDLAYSLSLASSRGEFVLHYQPKFDAASGEVLGAEALLRWNHPTKGMIPPSSFIPLAEKCGLIVSIGYWVLDEACRQLNVWHAAGHRNWTMAVNLSAAQFNDLALSRVVRDTLARHGVEPQYLTLEITESTAMRDVSASMAILEQLRDTGVRISIDDFGTGYSSLLYLKRLPANELKIDREFVRDVMHDAEDKAIITAIVALGRTLNLEIVAEGVETNEQREFLTRLGCSALQGFLLGRPTPGEQFTSVMWGPESIPAAVPSNLFAQPRLCPTPS